MNRQKIFILIFLITLPLFAQKKQFTMEDVVFNSYSSLAPESLNQLDWIPNSGFISFVEDSVLISMNSIKGVHTN